MLFRSRDGLKRNRSEAETTVTSTSPCSSWRTASAAVSPPKLPPSTNTFFRDIWTPLRVVVTILIPAAATAVLIGIFAVQVVVFVFMPLMGHEWWQAIVFTLVFGATFGSTVPARPLLIRQFFGPRSFGAVNGLAQGVAIVPAMVGPVMMGASFDAFHSYTPAIMAFAAITALMAPVPLLLRKAEG